MISPNLFTAKLSNSRFPSDNNIKWKLETENLKLERLIINSKLFQFSLCIL